jgi:hypothetical protein
LCGNVAEALFKANKYPIVIEYCRFVSNQGEILGSVHSDNHVSNSWFSGPGFPPAPQGNNDGIGPTIDLPHLDTALCPQGDIVVETEPMRTIPPDYLSPTNAIDSAIFNTSNAFIISYLLDPTLPLSPSDHLPASSKLAFSMDFVLSESFTLGPESLFASHASSSDSDLATESTVDSAFETESLPDSASETDSLTESTSEVESSPVMKSFETESRVSSLIPETESSTVTALPTDKVPVPTDDSSGQGKGQPDNNSDNTMIIIICVVVGVILISAVVALIIRKRMAGAELEDSEESIPEPVETQEVDLNAAEVAREISVDFTNPMFDGGDQHMTLQDLVQDDADELL